MKKHSHIWKILVFDMFVIEFGPVGVFFLVYYLADFPQAALALGVATLLALVLSKVVNKRVPWFAIFSGTITMITSVITYIYTAPTVLILKDTVYYFLFAGILLFGVWKERHIFEKFFGHIFALAEEGWKILERRWLVFFLIAGVLNEVVRMSLSTSEWVVYKQVVVIGFVLFGMYQFQVSMRYRLAEADEYGLRRISPSTTETE